ncbi:MAG: YggS family pyridoxal phosphate-dependent enzyme [Fimbriimonadaceae bacterium]
MWGSRKVFDSDRWREEVSRALADVRERIRAACESVGRDPGDVVLVAVSKGVPADGIRAAYDSGVRDFGESRVQELLAKRASLPADVRWHFVGKLQSNKIRKVAGFLTMLHSLETDSQISELTRLSRADSETDLAERLPLDCLVEVNIAEEPQKSGVLPSALDEYLETVLNCRAVRFRGLMTIGPQVDHPEEMRSYFSKLREIAERLGDRVGKSGGKSSELGGKLCLSMGMSGDFDVAIQEGATHVRVGTALFGGRR